MYSVYVVVNFLFQLIFVFPLFSLAYIKVGGIIYYHTQKQWKIKN